MFIYWRVQQDLDELANVLVFHHPNFAREYEKWCRKNAAGLRIAADLGPDNIIEKGISLN